MFVGCGPLCESDEFPHFLANFEWKKQIQLPACAGHCSQLCSSWRWAGCTDPLKEFTCLSRHSVHGGIQFQSTVLRPKQAPAYALLRTSYMTSLLPHLRMMIINLIRFSGELDLTLLQLLLSHILAAKDIIFDTFTGYKPIWINCRWIETTRDGNITYNQLTCTQLTVRCMEYVGHQSITWFLN